MDGARLSATDHKQREKEGDRQEERATLFESRRWERAGAGGRNRRRKRDEERLLRWGERQDGQEGKREKCRK